MNILKSYRVKRNLISVVKCALIASVGKCNIVTTDNIVKAVNSSKYDLTITPQCTRYLMTQVGRWSLRAGNISRQAKGLTSELVSMTNYKGVTRG